jgi:hypothetical protein
LGAAAGDPEKGYYSYNRGEWWIYALNRPIRSTWNAVYAANVAVVINGHDRGHKLFRPMEPDGDFNYERGIREFVVGTGGKERRSFGTVKANRVVSTPIRLSYSSKTFDAAKYSLKVVPVVSESFTDSGSRSSH